MQFGKQKSALFSRLHAWMTRHKAASIAIASVVVLLAGGLVTFALFYDKPEPVKKTVSVPRRTPPKPIIYYSPLTGEKVKDAAATTAPVTAIMIENSPSARPQSGLKEAGVVYEAVAEGGITRFLALYQSAKPQLVGPVRSLRMYYVDWLAPYQASVAHVGGSFASLQEIRNGKYRDIDQFFNPAYYWRASDRYAPHNVYTSFQKLDELNRSKGYTSSKFTGFKRGETKPPEVPEATAITLGFGGPLYETSYLYDKASDSYARNLAGAPHLDREKGQIAPKVVIAMKVSMQPVFEDGYREQIKTTGSGEAVIFQNGRVIKGSWHKAGRSAQIIFTNTAGEEVALARGQTWIAAIPIDGGTVTWK